VQLLCQHKQQAAAVTPPGYTPVCALAVIE
jgi:hypothetical protein